MTSVGAGLPAPGRRAFLGRLRGCGLVSCGLILMPAVASLAGCASLLDPHTGSPAVDQQWAGRFALVVEPDVRLPEGDRQSGHFELTRRGRLTSLELLSPLGNTIASARTGPDGAILRTADGRSFEDVDGEALTEQVFGWRLPVDRLADWLQGRVAEVTEWGPAADGGRRPVLGQDRGWQVRFDQWSEPGQSASPPQPSRLVISHPGRLRLTLVVNRP